MCISVITISMFVIFGIVFLLIQPLLLFVWDPRTTGIRGKLGLDFEPCNLHNLFKVVNDICLKCK